MRKAKRISLITAVAALLVSMTAGAGSASVFMPTGGPTLQPVGHYEFCQREPQECGNKTLNHRPVPLTRELWATMVEINSAINTAVQPRTDMEMWGVEEYWSYPDLYGDCEDYALEKRRLLMKAGVPAGNLLMTVVLQPNGSGHAVLTVNTSTGDFILDNMEPRILLWSQTGYRFLKRQSAKNDALWVSIHDGRDAAVGSISSGR